MLPLLHNPTLSSGGKMLMKPWSRTIEDRKRKREREKEEWLPSSLVYQCKLLTRQASPSSPSLCFPGLHFDWISILMKDCNAPKLCLNPSINSQQLCLLLICNFCRAPVEKHGIRIMFSSLQSRKVLQLYQTSLKHEREQLKIQIKIGQRLEN